MIRECLHEETGTTPFECHSFLKEVLARGLCDKLGHWEESADTKTSKLYIMVSTTVVFFVLPKHISEYLEQVTMCKIQAVICVSGEIRNGDGI